jgi:hypothetical protein
MFNKIKLKNSEMYLQIKSVFYKSRPLDTEFFLKSWEHKYNAIADPQINEVISRLTIIINNLRSTSYTHEVKPILELGAGYGRITKHLIKYFPVFSIEPNEILFEKLISKNKNSWNIRFQDFNSNMHFSIAFSVRSLEYLNLFEMIIFFRKLQSNCELIVVWENSQTIRRITKAALFSNKLRVLKEELYL